MSIVENELSKEPPTKNTPAKTAQDESPEVVPARTPLYQVHVDAGARLVDFAGWQMPVNYGSQIEEHHACRNQAVVFDVSHMTVLDISSRQNDEATTLLHYLLANNIDKAKNAGDAIYSCMLNSQGGIVDDLIAYRASADSYRLIVNAGTRAKDIEWISRQIAELDLSVDMQERVDLALLAVQGPQGIARALDAIKLCAEKGLVAFDSAKEPAEDTITALKRFSSCRLSSSGSGEWFVARTGYTGEDGLEISLPAEHAPVLWNALLASGVKPAGLGARDTLRLEAAMNLYGNDMDETVNPLQCGVAWTVAWQPETRKFCGREAVEDSKEHGVNGFTDLQLVGLVLNGRGVIRSHQAIQCAGQVVGEVTSGTFSPTLQKSIALARVSMNEIGVSTPEALYSKSCEVIIRDKAIPAEFVKPPFLQQSNLKT